jgi:hypothetical protein
MAIDSSRPFTCPSLDGLVQGSNLNTLPMFSHDRQYSAPLGFIPPLHQPGGCLFPFPKLRARQVLCNASLRMASIGGGPQYALTQPQKSKLSTLLLKPHLFTPESPVLAAISPWLTQSVGISQLDNLVLPAMA